MEVIISNCVLCIEWMIVICETVAQVDASKGRSEDIFLERAHYYFLARWSLCMTIDATFKIYPHKTLISYTNFCIHATLSL